MLFSAFFGSICELLDDFDYYGSLRALMASPSLALLHQRQMDIHCSTFAVSLRRNLKSGVMYNDVTSRLESAVFIEFVSANDIYQVDDNFDMVLLIADAIQQSNNAETVAVVSFINLARISIHVELMCIYVESGGNSGLVERQC